MKKCKDCGKDIDKPIHGSLKCKACYSDFKQRTNKNWYENKGRAYYKVNEKGSEPVLTKKEMMALGPGLRGRILETEVKRYRKKIERKIKEQRTSSYIRDLTRGQ